MHGKLTFTTKEYARSEHEIFPSMSTPGAKHLAVSPTPAVESFLGFGVAITPSSCYELNKMEPEARAELLHRIYGKDGMGLSVGRLCIGSSDYSPEMYSYDDVEGDVSLAHFSIERDEEYVIPIIKEILAIRPDLYLYASPWSPPYWMKTGGSMCGGFMREEYLDCYADYIVKFLQAYAAHGIHISAVTPQNEPGTQASCKMPACIWHPETEARFIGILKQKFEQNGLDIKVWMLDHNFDEIDRVVWALGNCPDLRKNCDGVAFHYYLGTIEQTAIVRKLYPEQELHFTEGGPRLTERYDCDFCKWGLMVVKAIGNGYRSFTGWNLMLNELGGPNIGPYIGLCGGFVTRNTRTGDLSYSGQYKAFSHIVPLVTPASKLYYVCSDESFGPRMAQYPVNDKKIEGLLIDTPNAKKTVFLVNPNEYCAQVQIEVDGTLWYIELRADSVATVELG